MPKKTAKTHKYIYWIESENGGIGGWTSRKKAERAKEFFCKHSTKPLGKIVRYKAVPCPICGQPEREDIVNSFGKCLHCDKLEADAWAEWREQNEQQENE